MAQTHQLIRDTGGVIMWDKEEGTCHLRGTTTQRTVGQRHEVDHMHFMVEEQEAAARGECSLQNGQLATNSYNSIFHLISPLCFK
jgi:hypothetical protein